MSSSSSPGGSSAAGHQSARDTVIVTATWLVPFVLAATWLWRFLFAQYDLRGARLVRLLFSASFALSMGMLLLVIYEVASVLDPRTRWLTWRITFVLDVALLVVVLPVSFIYFLARGFSFLSFRAVRLLTVVFEIGFIWVFWQAGKMFPIMRGGVAHDFLSLEGFIGRLGVIGVTTAAILAGYGSISTPYNYLSVFLQEVKDRDLLAARRNLRSTVDALLEKQTQLAAACDTLDKLREERRRRKYERLRQHQHQRQQQQQQQQQLQNGTEGFVEGEDYHRRRSPTPSRRQSTLAVAMHNAAPPPTQQQLLLQGGAAAMASSSTTAVGPWHVSQQQQSQWQRVGGYESAVGVASSGSGHVFNFQGGHHGSAFSSPPPHLKGNANHSSSNDHAPFPSSATAAATTSMTSPPQTTQHSNFQQSLSPLIISPTVVIVGGRRERAWSNAANNGNGADGENGLFGADGYPLAPGSGRKAAAPAAVAGALKRAWRMLGGGGVKDDDELDSESDVDVGGEVVGGGAPSEHGTAALNQQQIAGAGPDGGIPEAKRAVRQLRREASVLQDLQREMSMELEEMAATRERILESRTIKGRFFNALGYFLSVYGVYRVISAMVSIVMRQAPGKDPVTRGFEILLIFLNVPNAHLWMQPVSFTFVGILVFTNVRGILISFSNIFSALGARAPGSTSSGHAAAGSGGGGRGKGRSVFGASNGSSSAVSDPSSSGNSASSSSGGGGGGGGGGGVTTHAMVLLLAQVMGTYFVATVLMMRMSMPEQFRQGVSRSIGEIEFSFFHRWFDVIYVLSACASIIIFMTSYAVRASRSSGMSAEEREAFKSGELTVEFEGDDAAGAGGDGDIYGNANDATGTQGKGVKKNKGLGNGGGAASNAPRMARSLSPSRNKSNSDYAGYAGRYLHHPGAEFMRKRAVGGGGAGGAADGTGASAGRLQDEDQGALGHGRDADDDADAANERKLLLLSRPGAGPSGISGVGPRPAAAGGGGAGVIGRGRAQPQAAAAGAVGGSYGADRASLFARGSKVVSSAANLHAKIP